MKKTLLSTVVVILLAVMLVGTVTGCSPEMTSNDVQRQQQNKMLNEATSQTGMPNIKNFRERKILKDILELRDQEGLVTYTYLENELPRMIPGKTALGGKLTYLGETVGYGIPYATQYTAPETVQRFFLPAERGVIREFGYERLPQADPNGLFSPEAAEGTWILMKDPHGDKTVPIYIEPRVVVSPFKLDLDAGPFEELHGK